MNRAVADRTDSPVAVAQRFEPSGLGASEVAERVAQGRVNAAPAPPVRTLGEIICANMLTWVNAIVGTLFVLVLVAGRPADGLFVGIVLSNSVIGILRRSGADEEVAVGEVVADEVLVVRVGDQLSRGEEIAAAATTSVSGASWWLAPVRPRQVGDFIRSPKIPPISAHRPIREPAHAEGPVHGGPGTVPGVSPS